MSNAAALKLKNAPIIEAIIDVDCDLSPAFDLAALEGPLRDRFRDQYPKFQKQFIQEHKIETKPDEPPKTTIREGLSSFQFLHADAKQLVQVRAQGYSFNRLSPYSSLDNYIPEIERTWRLYVELIAPVQIRVIRLRYINRIVLPMAAGRVNLDDHIKVGPRLPDEEKLLLATFLNQYTAVEKDSGHQVNVVLTSEAPESEKLPIILDIGVANEMAAEPIDWPRMITTIQSLRGLKNRIFMNTLTEQCFKLFQ